MVDRRQKDADWQVLDGNGRAYLGSYHHSILAVLMDLRDELKALNRIIGCHNFIAVPSKLDAIVKNTRKRRKKRVVGKPKLRVVG